MKKVKFLSLLVLVVSMLAVCFFSADAAETFTENGYSYQITGTDSVSIVGIDSSITGDVVIPATLGGYRVARFYSVFKGNKSITSVVIPEGVISITTDAFYDCTNLKYVYVPSTVTGISNRAFYLTDSLEAVYVDSDNQAYASDENGVLFDKKMTTLIKYPENCPLTEYSIPDSVETVGETGFYRSKKLVSVTLSENLTVLDSSSFASCKALTTVICNEKLSVIGNSAFAASSKLASIDLPDTLTEIQKSAFYACSNLVKIDVPEGVVTIGDGAFSYCTKLTDITISSTVESIGVDVFESANALRKINVSAENKYYSDDSGILFDKSRTVLILCPPKNDVVEYVVPESVLTIEKAAFYNNSNLKTIVLSEGIKNIGSSAFENATALASVTIPASVEEIGDGAFVSCSSMVAYTVDNGNKFYSSDEYNALYDKEQTVLIAYPAASDTKEYIIPATVVTVKRKAMSSSCVLDKLVISDSVEIIEKFGIEKSTIKEIVIGNGLADVGGRAFYNCRINTISVNEKNNYFSVEDNILYNKDKTVLVKYPTGKNGDTLVIPDTVNEISENAFASVSLKSVIMPNNVEKIGTLAFEAVNSIKEITIVNPNAVLSSNCLPLNSGYTVYGYRSSTAEKYCSSLNKTFVPLYDGLSVDYEDGVLILSGTSELPVIDNENMCPWAAFAESTDCILIRDISLISANAFSEFYEISSIIFESDNITVEDNAFADCHNLKTVICYSDAEFGEAAFSTQTENLLFFKENDKNIISNYDFITFTYEDGIVSFDKPVTIEHYDFFNLVVALCSRYPVVNELMFNEFTLLNGNLEWVSDEDRVEISSFTNDKLAVQILDEEIWDLVTVSFTELCEGVANGRINAFVLVVIDENDEIQDSTDVDSAPDVGIDNIVTYILRAIITFFNKLLNLFR